MRKFDTVVIVGVGLIGASIGLELVSKRLAKQVIGVGRSAANLQVARRRRAIHSSWQIRHTQDLFRSDRLQEADLIILATPVRAIVDFLVTIPDSFVRAMRPGAVITDVGSTKRGIVALAERRIHGPVSFVGGHPIAGTEQSGASAAQLGLFRGRVTVVTRTPRTIRRGLQAVRTLWRLLGAEVRTMTPPEHDRLLALASHLPHMVAYSLANAVSAIPKVRTLAGGGLRDFTRIAASDPVMWRDICLENRQEILKAMERFERRWKDLKKAVREADAKALCKQFIQ